MRKAWILVLAALVLSVSVLAQSAPAPPPDVNNVVINKITQEHQNTRQFTSAELTRQREEFYKQFDDRAAFYEQEFFDTLNTAVLKLSLIWGAIVFCTVGLSNMLRVTLERKRFKRMKETIKDELKAEIFLKNPPKAPRAQQSTVFQQPYSDTAAYAYSAPQPTLQDKDGYFARRKKRKMAAEIEALERERAKQADKAAALRAKLGNPQPAAYPQAFAPAQGLSKNEIIRMTAEYNQRLMQKYMEEQRRVAGYDADFDVPSPPQQPRVETY